MIKALAKKLAPQIMKVVLKGIEEQRRDHPEEWLDDSRAEYLDDVEEQVQDLIDELAGEIYDSIDFNAAAATLFASRPRISWK